MARVLRLLAAWGIGWAVSLVAVLVWGYDGFPTLIFGALTAAVVSTVSVAVALLAGLVFLVRPVGRLWNSEPMWATGLAALCLAVMCVGSRVGLTAHYADPETGRAFVALHPVAALSSYLLLLFAIAHWPRRPSQLPTRPGR
jgi:hypothetical protein